MILTTRLAPEIHRALRQRGIIAAAPLALPGLPAPALRATLSLDGDLLVMLETGRRRGEQRLGAEAVCRILAAHQAALDAGMARLLDELSARQRALAAEIRRLGQGLTAARALAALAGVAPTIAGLLAGDALALAELAKGAAWGLGSAGLMHVVLRGLVRRAGRRLLSAIF